MEHTPPGSPPAADELQPRVEASSARPVSFGVDVKASELLADLMEATALAPADRLALVRGRTRQGEAFVEALVAEGLASSDGVARMLAARHGLPLVDLHTNTVSPEAAMQIPLHVLQRAVALPYRLDGETLHMAITDPQNVHAIDELRLATRYRPSLGVAARDDVLAELERIRRAADTVVESPADNEGAGNP